MAARHQPEEEPNELLERIVGGALRGVMLEYEEEISRFLSPSVRQSVSRKRRLKDPRLKDPRPLDTIVTVEKV